MRALVPGFVHRPGVHCGSTALRDALAHAGIGWSEPMVFGLASGLWFLLLRADGMSPSRMFVGRSGLFEQHFSANTGLVIAEETTRDVEAAWSAIKELVAGGEPVLLKADIRYLPYYATQTEFNGHKIVCAGFDEEADEVLVADTHFEGLQKISVGDLKRTISSAGAPIYFPDCMFAPVRRTAHEVPVAEAIRRSLAATGQHMVADPSELGGLGALDAFARELSEWRGREDAKWIARFGYQVIERRGTGGGLFRKMYAAFLREAAACGLEGVPIARWADAMEAIAARWANIAAAMKRASEDEATAWDEAANGAREVARSERELFEEIAERMR